MQTFRAPHYLKERERGEGKREKRKKRERKEKEKSESCCQDSLPFPRPQFFGNLFATTFRERTTPKNRNKNRLSPMKIKGGGKAVGL